MKISRWYQDFNWGGFWIITLFVVIIGGLIASVAFPMYRQHKIESKFPVGSAIQLKGLDIKGNVSEYTGADFLSQQVVILVMDKSGEQQKITVDTKLLQKQ